MLLHSTSNFALLCNDLINKVPFRWKKYGRLILNDRMTSIGNISERRCPFCTMGKYFFRRGSHFVKINNSWPICHELFGSQKIIALAFKSEVSWFDPWTGLILTQMPFVILNWIKGCFNFFTDFGRHFNGFIPFIDKNTQVYTYKIRKRIRS